MNTQTEKTKPADYQQVTRYYNNYPRATKKLTLRQ